MPDAPETTAPADSRNITTQDLTQMLRRNAQKRGGGARSSDGKVTVGGQTSETVKAAPAGNATDRNKADGTAEAAAAALQETSSSASTQNAGTESGTRTKAPKKPKAPSPTSEPGQEEPTRPDESPPEEQPTEEPAPEETTEGEGGEDEEGEQEQEQEGEDLSKAIGKMRKRIGKLTAQREAEREARLEAERARDELKAQLEGKDTDGARRSVRPTSDPFGHVPEVATLNERLQEVQNVLAWTDANPDGGEAPDGKGGVVEYTADQVRTIRRQAEEARIDLKADKAALVAQLRTQDEADRRKFHAEALEAYPWLQKKDSQEFQFAVEILRQLPEIQRAPDFKLVLGDYIVGRNMRLNKAKTAVNGVKPMTRPKGPTTPTPVVTANAATAPRGGGPKAKVKEAEQKFQESGSTRSLATLFRTQRQAARAEASGEE